MQHCTNSATVSRLKITCSVCVCARTGFEGRISRKRLKTQARFQWNTNRKWHSESIGRVTDDVTWSYHERSRSWPQYACGSLSRKWLKIQTLVQRITYRKWHLGSRVVPWPMTSR